MKPKHQRLWLLVISAIMACGGASLLLYHFQQQLIYFYTPSQLKQTPPEAGKTIRIGGLVEAGSVSQTGDRSIRFTITDLSEQITVTYEGLLPNLFREGQGVVAEGVLNHDGQLVAAQVLAKHDENYMPPEVVDALKKSGRWQHDTTQPAAPE